MIQHNNLPQKRLSLRDQLRIQNSLQNPPQEKPIIKKATTLPQQMMDDFLCRQGQYERINKPYQIEDRELKTQSFRQSQPNRMKNVVNQAKQQFIESNSDIMKVNIINRKRFGIEQMAELMRKQKHEKGQKVVNTHLKQKQLDLRMLLIVMIPALCLLTVLMELI